jgi:hypothetical protein
MSGDAQDFNNIETPAIIKDFSLLQGKTLKEIKAVLKEALGEHAPSYATVRHGWASLNVVIFPPVMHLALDDPKQ